MRTAKFDGTVQAIKGHVAVASAIASERPMILFDEPTSGLDLFHMRQVANVVNQVANAGRTAPW